MRGLDTNVLLRYLAGDDPEQSRVARDLFEAGEERRERFYISTVVLCESVWTLRSYYRMGRDSISDVIEKLLASSLFEVQDHDLVRRTLLNYRHGQADFADYLIGWQNWRAGCTDTVTFDRDLKGAEGFFLLS